MSETVELPTIDLSSSDRITTAKSIRQACLDHGFFYIINHGIEVKMLEQLFDESRKFFSLPLEEKMKLARNKEHRGYTPLYAEKLDPSLKSRGDLKESFYIGPMEGGSLNQWPSEVRMNMTLQLAKILSDLTVGKRLISLIALALNLDENFFEKLGALDPPRGFIRLLHYPGEPDSSDIGTCRASAHSDYGMITNLATNGIRGLQICREKDKLPQKWEDVPHIGGALIVNIGDMMERWSNCLFRSTLHRVTTGQERYSVAFFLDPNSDCVVKCLETCCSETSPPKFPPIRSGDYLQERFRITYAEG